MGLLKNVVLVIVALIVLYMIISYFNPSSNKLSGLKQGNVLETISAKSLPNGNNSNNYTYSMWFYVSNWNTRLSEKKMILQRGGDSSGSSGNPSVYLTPFENNIEIELSTYQVSSNTPAQPFTCGIQNVPLQKWVNLLISLNGRSLDIYIDGKLVRTCVLPNPSKINNNDNIFITPGGGFEGWTSKIQYWPSPMNPQQAYDIYKQGFGGGGMNFFDKYRIKFSYLVDNEERGSFEI